MQIRVFIGLHVVVAAVLSLIGVHVLVLMQFESCGRTFMFSVLMQLTMMTSP
jgi:hypothetical protein